MLSLFGSSLSFPLLLLFIPGYKILRLEVRQVFTRAIVECVGVFDQKESEGRTIRKKTRDRQPSSPPEHGNDAVLIPSPSRPLCRSVVDTHRGTPLLWRQIGYGLEALFMVSSDLKIRISKRFAFFAASQGRSKFMKGDGCGNPDQSETR
ncbi:hypothetical protein AVEN_102189-1 [Araneus ventricosus]|uniref:Uncharacterized protein n=1 Tax=Araneus ventricosus TaxID=182803 RepID=A0A4Y2PTL7_ARAVE|nr:hypothetical protein AVEN_102189-1 [Araneus ventricosus]